MYLIFFSNNQIILEKLFQIYKDHNPATTNKSIKNDLCPDLQGDFPWSWYTLPRIRFLQSCQNQKCQRVSSNQFYIHVIHYNFYTIINILIIFMYFKRILIDFRYVKWMMYWIVFALFTSIETFSDFFLSFWFPFYYEIKICFLIWLLSPATKGSSLLYR